MVLFLSPIIKEHLGLFALITTWLLNSKHHDVMKGKHKVSRPPGGTGDSPVYCSLRKIKVGNESIADWDKKHRTGALAPPSV